MLPIQVAVGDIRVDGELNDTESARELARALPLTAPFNVWGDEIHLDVALAAAPARHPEERVEVGDLGFWAEGGALCIFFGPTPLSPAEDPVAPAPVTIVGKLRGAEALRSGKGADQIRIARRDPDAR